MITSFFFFVLFASSMLVAQSVYNDEDAALATRCREETKVTQEVVDSFARDPAKDPTEGYLCYLKCFLLGSGLLNAVGEIQFDLYKPMTDASMDCLKKVPNVEKCADVEAILDCVRPR